MTEPLFDFVSNFVANYVSDDSERAEEESAYITSVLERAFDLFEVEWLGGGNYGLAAGVMGDRVLKLTTDPDEVRAASVVALHPLPHVVRTYGAWFLPIPERKEPIGVVFMERVSRMDQDPNAQIISSIVSSVKNDFRAWGHFLARMDPKRAREKLRQASIELEMRLYIAGQSSSNRQLFQDIGSALRELREIGIYAIDPHRANIGYSDKDDAYKVFDLGTSSVPDKTVPMLTTQPVGVAPMATEVPTLE